MQHHRVLSWIAVIFIVIIVMGVFYISARPPQMDSELDGQTTEITTPEVTFVDPARGPDQAAVTIVEYSDFTCSACKDMAANIARLQTELPNDLKHVYKYAPTGMQETAVLAAVAAACANEQGRFWEYHDTLFLNQDIISEQIVLEISNFIGLDENTFSECLEKQSTLPLIERTFEEAAALSLTALPTFFIGEERYVGSISYDELEKIVREAKLLTE
jgi:protein-disulfide isomerase